jgi:hypothetical protein
MSDSNKGLLVVKTEQLLCPEVRAALSNHLEAMADRLGVEMLIADGGLDVGMHRDLAPLLERQIELQQETNQLLETLVMALAEDADPDAPPLTYMDGTPVG